MGELRVADLRVVNSPGGTMVHLVTPRDLANSEHPQALCGNQVAGLSRVWFALNGCKRCAKAAIKTGADTVVDVDGQLVALADVTAR